MALTPAKLRRVAKASVAAWQPNNELRWVGRRTAGEIRRLRRHADAYDELLMKRLAQRGEHSAALETGGDVPGEEDALVDTALYLAASHENARAAARAARTPRPGCTCRWHCGVRRPGVGGVGMMSTSSRADGCAEARWRSAASHRRERARGPARAGIGTGP